MRITFINVGYGDAILFQDAHGYTALLDGGSNLEQEFDGDAFRIRAAAYLKAQKITHIDDVFISHIHEDHVCGLEAIFREFPIDNLYVPYPVQPFLNGAEVQPASDARPSVHLYTKALNAYRRILTQAYENGVSVRVLGPGDRLTLTDGLSVQVCAPRPAAIDAYMERVEQVYKSRDAAEITQLLGSLDAMSNRTSLLLGFEMERVSLLAAADSCPREWGEVPLSFLKNVNVLKLPHHGQIDSIDEQLMQVMPLEYVITTASSDRRYNSANPAVYERILALYPETARPRFLFSDERDYPPYFSMPDGFQAITLVIDSDTICPEFICISC